MISSLLLAILVGIITYAAICLHSLNEIPRLT